MSDHVSVIGPERYMAELAIMAEHIAQVVDSGPYVIHTQGDEPFHSDDVLNAITAMWLPTGLQSSIRDTFVESCRLSRSTGGNPHTTARLSTALLRSIIQAVGTDNPIPLLEDIRESISTLKMIVGRSMRQPDDAELRVLVGEATNNACTRSAVLEAFTTAGLEGRIILDRHTGPDLTVELTHGSRFELDVPTPFLGNGQRWQARDVRCLVVDGRVEQVSEIHGILDAANRAGDAVALFFTGYDNEVFTTLHTNLMRGTLNVMPMTIRDDIDSVNKLADISIVCGCDLISSLKGQLISTITYDRLPTVDSVVCTPGSVVIVNDATATAQGLQIMRLEKRITDGVLTDVSDLYETRIRALASTCATISAPAGDKHTVDATLESLEAGITVYRSLIARGCVDWQTLRDEALDLHPCVRETLDAMPDRSISTHAVLSALEHGVANVLLIAGAGAMLELEALA